MTFDPAVPEIRVRAESAHARLPFPVPLEVPLSVAVPASASLDRYEFSTVGLPISEQFEAWRSCYSSAFELQNARDLDAGFAARQEVWDFGSLVFCHVKTEAVKFAGLAGYRRREPLDHWLFTLLLSGRSLTLSSKGLVRGAAGVVQVKPLDQPFEGHISECEMLMLFVPRDLCRNEAHVLDAVAFARLESGMGCVLGDYLISLARRLPLLSRSELPEIVAATRAMLLACAEPSVERLEEAEGTVPSLQLERVRKYVQSNLQDPTLSPQRITRELGLSRSRLYRLFEASDGVMHYIQRRRLTAAHAALADPSDTRRILEIAECFCFDDAAQFSRAFRRTFGCSPSDVRSDARHHRVPALKPAADVVEASPVHQLNRLLLRLQG